MTALTIIYILNVTLLLLHEIESAYVKEWEIFKLPGTINGFVVLHIPILLVLFWGAIQIEQKTTTGAIIGVGRPLLRPLRRWLFHRLARRRRKQDRPLRCLPLRCHRSHCRRHSGPLPRRLFHRSTLRRRKQRRPLRCPRLTHPPPKSRLLKAEG